MKVSRLLAFATTMTLAASAVAQNKDNYCVSLRGNGFRVFAHFGALAQVVESYGAPSAMSGGSSSTLTMYLADQIFQNPLVAKDAEKTAFLLKLIEPLLNELLKLPEIEMGKELALKPDAQKKLKEILDQLKGAKGIGALPKIAKLYATEPVFRDFLALVQSETFKTLINPKATANILFSKELKAEVQAAALARLGRELNEEEMAAVKAYRASQFNQALSSLQKFSVSTDANFLFREGLLNQEGLSQFLEPIARFLSVKNLEQSNLSSYKKFLSQCAEGSQGKQWSQIVSEKPACAKTLTSLATLIYKEQADYNTWKKNPSVAEYKDRATMKFRKWQDISNGKIGQSMPMLGMTSLLRGDAVQAFEVAQQDYLLTTDPQFGFQFEAKAQDFAVGYWGQQSALLKAERNILSSSGFQTPNGQHYDFSQDEKSRRFVNLGEATWAELMSYSTAEPGQGAGRITQDARGQKVVTTGGWFDHLSAPLLKASGCDNVVAITRNKGDSKFGQEVFARMVTDGGKHISQINDTTVQAGDQSDVNSLWGKLFNVKNANSSANSSLRATDVVVCSFWDDIHANSAPAKFFNLGYTGKASFENSRWSAAKNLWLKSEGRSEINRSENTINPTTGAKLYSGCLIDDEI